MQVHVHPSSFVVGQPITPVSWPRKLPRPSHISVNTSRRPASADSTCTTSSTLSAPPSPSPVSPSSSSSSLLSPHSSSSRPESEVHRAVSRLLSLTKQMQEVINLWAQGSVGESDVSDAFILVASQFDSTVHAFWRVSVDMSDLFDVPRSLRAVLEGMLAEYPSPDVLARYTPRIRKIVVDLLRGLQSKQSSYWAAVGRSRDSVYLSPMSAAGMRDR
ncbi:hypothetical protein C8Q79DRAFT_250278 [Trametes meyenii]|nr:hypothetical protein C8Q79DRAFT_250278 [Trametes meyenii]